jgi:hypothetical protein
MSHPSVRDPPLNITIAELEYGVSDGVPSFRVLKPEVTFSAPSPASRSHWKNFVIGTSNGGKLTPMRTLACRGSWN